MKLAKLRIENFRHLGTGGKPFELDFTDALGRVRDFTLLVGPNTSGKTTVLDAIAAALGPSLEMPTLRQGFKLSPRTVVSHGELQTKVTCWLRFEEEEVRTAKALYDGAEPVLISKVPDIQEVMLTWAYPDLREKSSYVRVHVANIGGSRYIRASPRDRLEDGFTEWSPSGGEILLQARVHIARLLATGQVGWDWLRRAGGVFTFDQERTGLGRTISRQVWNIIHGTTAAAAENQELQTTDPRAILIDLALQSLVPSVHASQRVPDLFTAVQSRYAEVCAPHQIVGAIRDELNEFSVRFRDGHHEYGYDGLSSGEKMVLLLLIRFVAEHIHHSIVLIDELELNQHPIWQRRLLHMLPRMGDGNQIIATTHSPYLRDAVSPDAVIDLGDLGDGMSAKG